MSELTELEICEGIAKIEGVYDKIKSALVEQVRLRNSHILQSAVTDYYPLQGFGDVYNPLTDGNILQGLIKKHSVQMYQNFHDYWIAECITEYDFDEEPISINPSVQKDYEWAACLAIIEKFK